MALEDGADGITWPFAVAAPMSLDNLAWVIAWKQAKVSERSEWEVVAKPPKVLGGSAVCVCQCVLPFDDQSCSCVRKRLTPCVHRAGGRVDESSSACFMKDCWLLESASGPKLWVKKAAARRHNTRNTTRDSVLAGQIWWFWPPICRNCQKKEQRVYYWQWRTREWTWKLQLDSRLISDSDTVGRTWVDCGPKKHWKESCFLHRTLRKTKNVKSVFCILDTFDLVSPACKRIWTSSLHSIVTLTYTWSPYVETATWLH